MQELKDLKKLVTDVKSQIQTAIDTSIKGCINLEPKEKKAIMDRINRLKELSSSVVLPSDDNLTNRVDISVANSEVIRKLNELVVELKLMMKI